MLRQAKTHLQGDVPEAAFVPLTYPALDLQCTTSGTPYGAPEWLSGGLLLVYCCMVLHHQTWVKCFCWPVRQVHPISRPGTSSGTRGPSADVDRQGSLYISSLYSADAARPGTGTGILHIDQENDSLLMGNASDDQVRQIFPTSLGHGSAMVNATCCTAGSIQTDGSWVAARAGVC